MIIRTYIAFPFVPLQCNTLPAFRNSTLHSLHYITLHYIALHYSTLHYITVHYITSHYITSHYIIVVQHRTIHTLHRAKITWHKFTLRPLQSSLCTLHHHILDIQYCITLQNATLHWITWHYITLPYIKLPYTKLPDITVPYMSFHHSIALYL